MASAHSDDERVLRIGKSDGLSGRIRVPGAKNCAIKLMPATVLASGDYTLHNVPQILDVEWMGDVLREMGAEVVWDAGRTLHIHSPDNLSTGASYEAVSRMRASIIMLGPLLARFGEASIAMPGGDDFGSRPIDMHLRGLEAMGAEFDIEHGVIRGRARRLKGAEIVLDYPSVGATEHLMMAASLAHGRTVLHNCAQEPEIADEAAFLNQMGAHVLGGGTSEIAIEGVERLEPTEHTVVGDRIVAGTVVCAAAASQGSVVIEGTHFSHMETLAYRCAEMGIMISPYVGGVSVVVDGPLHEADIVSLPYPGLPTDVVPMLVAALSVARGTSIATENLYTSRLGYIAELRRLGADIRADGHHIVVRGKAELSGAPVHASDIRGGAALAVAALAAQGYTDIGGTMHLDRGYEDLARDLASLGADATWVAPG